MSFSILTLGAGQEVGRSCVIANINGIRIMFDCGVHMVYNDSRKFPDFRRINPKNKETPIDKNIYANFLNTKDMNFNELVDLIVISHFHLDHCGALPYFTEVCNYNGPIVMTQPTKAIFPVTLEDFRRIISDLKGEKSLISNDDIQKCLKKISTIELFEEKLINNRIKLTCYYAGHVLGAAMFQVEVNGFIITYTGDYNTTVDRHLNGAYLPRTLPDVLITETTYGDTIRDTKRAREREFLKKVTEIIENKGKILIPIFALGRAQELCILLDTHWKRNKIKVPIYFFGAMSEKSNFYYKIFNNWTNERIKSLFLEHNVFNFENIISNYLSKHNEAYKQPNTPMVILSTPGMLHKGSSLNIFKEICTESNNCVIIPGYCTAGTVGNKILSGEKIVEIDNVKYDIKCQVYYMSFSAHADAKGLLHLVKNAYPTNLVLVHGDIEVMKTFKNSVTSLIPSINTYYPANYQEVVFNEKFVHKQIGISSSFFELISYCYFEGLNDINKNEKNIIFMNNKQNYSNSLQNKNIHNKNSSIKNKLVSSILNQTFIIDSDNKNKDFNSKKIPIFKLRKFFKSYKTDKINKANNSFKIKNTLSVSLNNLKSTKHQGAPINNESCSNNNNNNCKLLNSFKLGGNVLVLFNEFLSNYFIDFYNLLKYLYSIEIIEIFLNDDENKIIINWKRNSNSDVYFYNNIRFHLNEVMYETVEKAEKFINALCKMY